MIEKSAVKDLLYGALLEILNNNRYYYRSSIDTGFNNLTDQGKLVLEEYMKTMAPLMLQVEEESLNKRAKDMIINGLKGESV